MASSETGGVKPMTIAGRTVRERERLLGMSNEERAWRKQWLKDLELDHGPRVVPEMERELLNPIRRFYRLPLDKMGDALAPVLGLTPARYVRFWVGKFAMGVVALYAGAYYLKYNQNDWTRKGGWRVISSRVVCNPGDEGYPKLSERTQPSEYATRGFK
ncbi:uncharacterized protein ND-B17 [Eurosta solidaginis]|uniref:uncharacterized protein ND-B17 n=1 Tax=Eurosta solidaginis TaxID=178769 RepID=UPI0035310DD2